MGEEEEEGGHFKQKMSFGKCLPSANGRYVFGFRGRGFPLLGTRVEHVQTTGMSHLWLISVDLLAYLAEKSPSFQGLLVLKEGREKKRGEDVCPLSEVEFVQQVRDKKIFPVPLFPPCCICRCRADVQTL